MKKIILITFLMAGTTQSLQCATEETSPTKETQSSQEQTQPTKSSPREALLLLGTVLPYVVCAVLWKQLSDFKCKYMREKANLVTSIDQEILQMKKVSNHVKGLTMRILNFEGNGGRLVVLENKVTALENVQEES